MPSRRSILTAATGTAALVCVGGWWRVSRLPATATLPWVEIPPPTDVRLDALRHAILAPNPHNRQPWQIRLEGTDRAIVTCDLERRLPHTDPFDRQIAIGFGGFLELLRIAALERGVRAEITAFPDGEPQPRLDRRPIAQIRFVPDQSAVRDPLFSAIRARRSTKTPYDLARPISPADAAALAATSHADARVRVVTQSEQVAELRALGWQAMELELNTPRTLKESIDLLRIGAEEIDRNPDGISLGGRMFEGLSLLGTDTVRAQALNPQSSAFKGQADRLKATLAATPAFLVVRTTGNSRTEQLAAGRTYVRANLEATARGLGLHPWSQALQEYAEVKAPFDQTYRVLAQGGGTVQMLARLGYGTPMPPSPRWPLEAKLQR